MAVLCTFPRCGNGIIGGSDERRPNDHRLALCGLLSGAGNVRAADLKAPTEQAYEKHSAQAVREFVSRAQKLARESRRCDGVMTARAASGDGILNVPDGLIHNWMATAFVKGATLRQAADVARDYPSHSKVYENVKSAKVLSQQGDVYRVLLRLEEGGLGVEAVLDVRSTVEYRTLGDGAISAMSKSDEIRQVNNAGRSNESLRPAGRDSGYLWRAHADLVHSAPRRRIRGHGNARLEPRISTDDRLLAGTNRAPPGPQERRGVAERILAAVRRSASWRRRNRPVIERLERFERSNDPNGYTPVSRETRGNRYRGGAMRAL